MLTKVKSFMFGGGNLLNLVFLLLCLPYARVDLTKCQKMELLLHHLGLQLD